ncbi:MAG: hypothetical protein EA397_18155 [Deltaproteobacteria bacterium]|nr:MAG: hypothetical protein EA397_18155 [Deltaproteobacteria bacterium]
MRHPDLSDARFEEQLLALCDGDRTFPGPFDPIDARRRRRAIARDLGRSVRAGRYTPSPGHLRPTLIDGKLRPLVRSNLLDATVDRVLGRWLAQAIEPTLPPSLISYRRGLGPLDGWRRVTDWITRQAAASPDPRARHLWVLRRDVRRYGEHIPVGPQSPLWRILDQAIEDRPLAPKVRTLLRSLIQREILDEDGQTRTLTRGSPTGSSLQPSVNNLYLTELDRTIAALDGIYLRFGDDLIFASIHRAEAEQAEVLLDEGLTRLDLEWKASKSQRLYLTTAGRAGPPGWRGAARVGLLGMDLTAAGRIALSQDKWRHTVRSLRRRLGRIAHSPPFAAATVEERAQMLCEALRTALQPGDLRAIHHASALACIVDDPGQLRDFDATMLRRIASLATQIPSARAFRVLSPRALHALGFPSIVHRRNLSWRSQA